MDKLVNLFDHILYPQYADEWDNRLLRDKILQHLSKDIKVLDLGAGAGISKEMNFRNLAASVSGVDLDKRVLDNPYLDEAKVSSVEVLPYSNASFDLVICNNVLEHLTCPLLVFKEVRRILKPGGVFVIKTPNKFHYVTILARFTPHWFHKFYNRIRGIHEVDIFPVFYRINSYNNLSCYAKKVGFKIESLELIEGRPEYLRINCFLYLCGILYEKIVNSCKFFRHFRVLIIATFRKE